MYLPQHFEQKQWSKALSIINQYSFAQLITVDDHQQLEISHIPILYDRDSEQFIFHLAAPNPHCDKVLAGPSQLIFNGPHHYISPIWADDIVVPTWNYATVHVKGSASEVTTEIDKIALMTKMVDVYESANPNPWSVSDLSVKQKTGMLRGIRCFQLSIDSWQGKFKLSQNRSVSAIEQLSDKLQALNETAPELSNQMAVAKLMMQEYRDN